MEDAKDCDADSELFEHAEELIRLHLMERRKHSFDADADMFAALPKSFREEHRNHFVVIYGGQIRAICKDGGEVRNVLEEQGLPGGHTFVGYLDDGRIPLYGWK